MKKIKSSFPKDPDISFFHVIMFRNLFNVLFIEIENNFFLDVLKIFKVFQSFILVVIVQ